MSQDYYKTLEVKKNASNEEIRKAYKKLARQYHPDVKPNDAAAEKKFKEIQEAYAVIGDAEKRAKYDQFGHAAFQGAGGSPFNWQGGGGAGGFDFSDILGGMFDQGGGGFGGFGHQQRRQRPQPRKGDDIRTEITVPFHVAAEGGQHEITIRSGSETNRLTVTVPPGVNTGNVIRLAKQGHPGIHNGPAGDLLVTIKAAPHPWFKRDGWNLLLDCPISPAEAALGTRVEVPTLNDGEVVLTIPPATSSGTKLRLRGKGIRKSAKTDERGDQFIVIQIKLPQELSAEETSLFESLQEITESPRAELWQ